MVLTSQPYLQFIHLLNAGRAWLSLPLRSLKYFAERAQGRCAVQATRSVSPIDDGLPECVPSWASMLVNPGAPARLAVIMVEMIIPVGPVTVVVVDPSALRNLVIVFVSFVIAVDMTWPAGPVTVVETDPSAFVMVVVRLFVPLLLGTAATTSLDAALDIGFTTSPEKPLMARPPTFAAQP